MSVQSTLSEMRIKIVSLILAFAVLGLPEVKSHQCGQKRGFVGTVFGGKATKKGDWPWMVAFTRRPEDIFFCSGNLISKKHVLSGEL